LADLQIRRTAYLCKNLIPMAKETLTVKNFGPIREAHLDLGKVTVLIGPQASGKSVLAKLAAVFSDVLLNDIEHEFKSKLEAYAIKSFLKDNSAVKFNSEGFEGHLWGGNFSQNIKDSSLQRLLDEYKAAREAWRQSLFPKGGGRLTSDAGGRRVHSSTEVQQLRYAWINTGLELLKITPQARYLPAERTAISTIANTSSLLSEQNIQIQGFLRTFASDFDTARRRLSSLSIPFLKAKYEYANDLDSVSFGKGDKIQLSESATGFQSSIPMAVVIENVQREAGQNLFIIEEPELNLYPTTQKRLVEYLVAKCTKGNNRLIVTTHSPYILTALDNCIQADNVLKNNPEAKAEVDALVPPESQIAFEDVAAYFVADGTARSIMNTENRLIDSNALDHISEELGEIFDRLLDLEMQPT
jgi:hypothetical protein